MPDKTIFIYHLELADKIDCLIDYLHTAEKQQLRTIKSAPRRRVFIAGRAMLTVALQKVGCAADSDGGHRVGYSTSGKPYLLRNPDWQFNLTHSGEHLYLALQQSHAIGIDCEVMRTKNYQRVAKRLFNKRQRHYISSSDDPTLAFLVCWTQYEAQIKYYGKSVFSQPPPSTTANNVHSYRQQQQIISVCSTAGQTADCRWFDGSISGDSICVANAKVKPLAVENLTSTTG